MLKSKAFALHRPEFTDSLLRGDEKIDRLMGGGSTTYARSAELIRQGEDHDGVYRLRSGWAGRQRILPDGRTQIIMVFLPGDLFAIKGMFLTQHADAVVALSDAVCEGIDRRELKAAFDADPDIATRCIFQVVEEERRLHNWVVGLGQGDAGERLAHMVTELRGRLIRNEVIAPDALEFPLPMTQEQISGFLGMTPVHLSRILRRMREQDVLFIGDGAVRILNPAALKRLAVPVQDQFERAEAGASGREIDA